MDAAAHLITFVSIPHTLYNINCKHTRVVSLGQCRRMRANYRRRIFLLTLTLHLSVAQASYQCDEFAVADLQNWLSLHYTYPNRSAALPVLQPILDARDHPPIDAHQFRPICDADALTGPQRLDGMWYTIQAPEPHVVFEPHACQLRRLTAASARKCLDGKYVMFIGDSLTRYQYLSFAYFLSHMKHLPRYHGLEEPHLNDVRDWKRGWNQFMLEGSKQLVEAAAPGADVYESCDCDRVETADTIGGKGFREFRRLCIASSGLPANQACIDRLAPGDLKVGYQQAMGHPTWYKAPVVALRAVLAERPLPDVVVLNAGLWAPQGNYTGPEGPALALQHYRVLLNRSSAMVRTQGCWFYCGTRVCNRLQRRA